jgi:SAM-dependent methyltransferase
MCPYLAKRFRRMTLRSRNPIRTETMTNATVQWMDGYFYPGVHNNWDDALLRQNVVKLSRGAQRVLDVGAGAGIVSELSLRELRAAVHGFDLDYRITQNTLIDFGCIGDATAIPYADNSFDAVVANNVLEHLASPRPVFREIARVLRPGGRFHFKTPNRAHYVSFVARWTPQSVHNAVAAARGRDAEDTFVTWYRANTKGSINSLSSAAGLEIEELRFVERRPEYCRIHPLLYACGTAYERLVNSSERFEQFRVVLLGALRKRSN